MSAEIKATAICSVPGCDRSQKKRGYCNGHYLRIYKRGDLRADVPLLVQHGESTAGARTQEYEVWISMRDRCLNASNPAFKNYGGRGIKICASWLSSYSNFLRDMGRKPSAAHTIERKNNNEDYCPENCKWATRREQSNNTRRNRWLEFEGRRLTVVQWSREMGIHERTIRNRIGAGYSPKEALTRPVGSWAGFRKQKGQNRK